VKRFATEARTAMQISRELHNAHGRPKNLLQLAVVAREYKDEAALPVPFLCKGQWSSPLRRWVAYSGWDPPTHATAMARWTPRNEVEPNLSRPRRRVPHAHSPSGSRKDDAATGLSRGALCLPGYSSGKSQVPRLTSSCGLPPTIRKRALT
jgi:hypothetical protein